MTTKKAKTFNGQVFKKSYTRLNLSPTERTIFQRLLGFLIRNDKPFPYSAVSMAKLTGYEKRTIFRALDRLEYLRLIERVGMGKNRRFKRGSILGKILTTVTYRLNSTQRKDLTTATLCHQNLINRDTVSYRKTSLSLKLKEKGLSQEQIQEISWYIKNPHIKVKEEDRFLFESGYARIINE